ncbi:MAG TPA: TPM domain-containing protein, partial [Tepidisphaeraceae bacterium]|nr:TPM domain-containing protein [Tepidisphaeraceae bacterium]
GAIMSSLRRVGISFLLVLSWMWIYRLPDGSALAEVKDETGLFSSSAIKQADQATRQIKQKYGKEMLVEVFAEIPAELRGQYSPDRKDQFFADWIKRRFQDLKIDGIYVLICRTPSHIQVDAGGKTRERAFTSQNIDQLTNILATRFRNKEFDQGLLDAINYVDRTLAANLGTASASPNTANPQYHYNTPRQSNLPPRASGLRWYWWVLLIGIALFIIARLFRSRAPGGMYAQRYGGGNYPGGGYPSGSYPPGGYPPQSGGFGRGMMGGLLGGMAGGWLYDKMSHHDQGSGYAPPPDSSGYSQPGLGSDQGMGATGGSGADFGDSGGGGGGDFGGGSDAGGGGDMGGGGDGGSGADF